MVTAHPVQIGLVEIAAHPPSPRGGRALVAKRTNLAVGRRCLVDPPVGRIALRKEAQHLHSGTAVNIGDRVVAEILLTEDTGALADLRERDVGADELVFDRDDVLGRAVLAIAGHLPWVEFPAEARPPEEIDGRLIVLHFGWRDQCGQDDPSLATIDHLVIVVPKACTDSLWSER